MNEFLKKPLVKIALDADSTPNSSAAYFNTATKGADSGTLNLSRDFNNFFLQIDQKTNSNTLNGNL